MPMLLVLFCLSNGVYFLRGFFVDVEDQILILDQYENKPNYRIGLNVTETLVSSDVDPSLNDNTKNFTNFTAPGSDRLEITKIFGEKALEMTSMIKISSN